MRHKGEGHMNKLDGWKTIIASFLVGITGVFGMAGMDLNIDSNAVAGAIMTVIGVVFAILRTVTTGPVG